MDLVSLMYKYINRFINSDELLESLEELDLNNFTDEEKASIKKIIDDIKSIKDKIPNEVDEIEKNRLEINEKYVNGIDKILQNNTLENKLKEKFLKIREGLLEDKKKVKDGGKLYESLFTLLADNKLINHYWESINDYELLEFIAQYISVPIPPQIDQEKFNDLVKVGIKNNEREWLWRLAFNYNEKNKDFSLIEDYFIKERINEIFNQVTEENNLSLEDLDKLFSTNLEIKNKYLTEMQANAEDLTFWFNVETQKRKNNSISAIAISLLGLGAAIFMPSFALASSLILLFLLRKISKSNKKIIQELDKIDSTAEILNSKLDKLMTTIENNETFIFKLQKELYERKMTELKSNNEGNEKINKATALIEKYMNDGEYPQELDEEIKDLAIKMLQLKLNVNYRSLELLLHCARAKRNNELELEGPVMVLKLIRK